MTGTNCSTNELITRFSNCVNRISTKRSSVVLVGFHDSPSREPLAAAPADEHSLFSLLHFPHWSQYTAHKKSLESHLIIYALWLLWCQQKRLWGLNANNINNVINSLNWNNTVKKSGLKLVHSDWLCKLLNRGVYLIFHSTVQSLVQSTSFLRKDVLEFPQRQSNQKALIHLPILQYRIIDTPC